MEKKWLFVIGILIVMILAAISFLSITETTGSFVYGKCWDTGKLTAENELALKMKGCVVEADKSRVCCPFESCPDIAGVKC
jgi:hypothetical protein